MVMTRKFNEHLSDLKEKFSGLRNAALELNARECVIFQKMVNFQCHVLPTERIATDQDKIKAITDLPKTKNTEKNEVKIIIAPTDIQPRRK